MMNPSSPCRTVALALLSGGLFVAAPLRPVAPLAAAAEAESPAAPTGGRSPSQGLRPIGAPSAVDAYAGPRGFSPPSQSAADASAAPRNPAAPTAFLPAARGGVPAADRVIQTAYMQGGDFAMPPGNASVPPSLRNGGTQPAPAVIGGNGFATGPAPGAGGLQPPPLSGESTAGPAVQVTPSPSGPVAAPLPDGLQPVPSTAPLAAPPPRNAQPFSGTRSPSDAMPVPQPQLNPTWATADNCNLVSYPSGYRAEFGCGAPAPVMPMAYGAPPAAMAPPAILPAAVPVPYAPAPVGHRPLFTLGQEYYNVQLGQGIIGQPTAYVPGQGIRNFIRYLSP